MNESFPNVTLAMVMSLDGRTSVPRGIFPVSLEDQAHFRRLRDSFPYVLLGRKTWQYIRKHIKTAPPVRLVFTRDPTRHEKESAPGLVEFTNQTPRDALLTLRSRGVTRVLLAGGSNLNRAFIHSNLVTDLVITVEPFLLGCGQPLISGIVPFTRLAFQSIERLNDQGTFVLRYTVRK